MEVDFALMRKGKIMFKVPNGQDPYSAIGKYIRDHITAIEDIIAVIEIDDIATNQLFMVDMNEENYFIWNNDWYEGEKDVALIDFFPVSEAINPSVQPEIIRCKDCKWYELPSHKITENCVRWMKSNCILLPIKPNDYCSYAEKREEGE